VLATSLTTLIKRLTSKRWSNGLFAGQTGYSHPLLPHKMDFSGLIWS
jgi:hypothetical protein